MFPVPSHGSTLISWIVQGENSGINSNLFFDVPRRWLAKTYAALGKYANRDYEPFSISSSWDNVYSHYLIGDDRFTISKRDRGTLKKCMSTMINTMLEHNSNEYISEGDFKPSAQAKFGGDMFNHYPLFMDMSLYDVTSISKRHKIVEPDIKGYFYEYKHNINEATSSGKKVFAFSVCVNLDVVESYKSEDDWKCYIKDNNVDITLAFDGDTFLKDGSIDIISEECHSLGIDYPDALIEQGYKPIFDSARQDALAVLRKVYLGLMKTYSGLPIEHIQILPNTNSNVCGFNFVLGLFDGKEIDCPKIALGKRCNTYDDYIHEGRIDIPFNMGKTNHFDGYFGDSVDTYWTNGDWKGDVDDYTAYKIYRDNSDVFCSDVPTDILNFTICLEA